MKLYPYYYLDKKIEKIEEKLHKYSKTDSYDSGNRMHCTEYYLKGLYEAKRLTNKGLKEV